VVVLAGQAATGRAARSAAPATGRRVRPTGVDRGPRHRGQGAAGL